MRTLAAAGAVAFHTAAAIIPSAMAGIMLAAADRHIAVGATGITTLAIGTVPINRVAIRQTKMELPTIRRWFLTTARPAYEKLAGRSPDIATATAALHRSGDRCGSWRITLPRTVWPARAILAPNDKIYLELGNPRCRSAFLLRSSQFACFHSDRTGPNSGRSCSLRSCCSFGDRSIC
jgi:hypothetical protein